MHSRWDRLVVFELRIDFDALEGDASAALGDLVPTVSLADHLAAKGPELSTEEWIGHARMVGRVLDAHDEAPTGDGSPAGPGKLVTGNDLMEHFSLEPGPMIGSMLEKIDEARAAGGVTSKSEALAMAGAALRNLREEE